MLKKTQVCPFVIFLWNWTFLKLNYTLFCMKISIFCLIKFRWHKNYNRATEATKQLIFYGKNVRTMLSLGLLVKLHSSYWQWQIKNRLGKVQTHWLDYYECQWLYWIMTSLSILICDLKNNFWVWRTSIRLYLSKYGKC